jgi:hypothetical protein
MWGFHEHDERLIDDTRRMQAAPAGGRPVQIVCTKVGEREAMCTKRVKGFARPEAHHMRGQVKSANATDAKYANPPFSGRRGDGTNGIV